MTEQEILEGNMAICQFLGGEVKESWRVQDRVNYVWEGEVVNEFRAVHKMPVIPGMTNKMLLEQIHFHDDWNCLIKVVEAIESLHDDHHGYFQVHIHGNGCDIQGTNLWKALQDCSSYGWVYCSDPTAVFPTKIESTYYAVVQFIKWWNEFSKQKQ